MKIFVAILLLTCATGLHAAETNRAAMLKQTVADVNESLQTDNATNAAALLFALSGSNEVSMVASHLKSETAGPMYRQIFAQAVNLIPEFYGDPTHTAELACTNTIIAGTKSWEHYDNMKVMFTFVDNRWVFYDAQVDKTLRTLRAQKGVASEQSH